jgi:hypothetical protein
VNTAVTLTIFGLLVGTAQWLAVRRQFRAGWWIPVRCCVIGIVDAIVRWPALVSDRASQLGERCGDPVVTR